MIECEECKKYQEWQNAWRQWFLEFMTRYSDVDITNPIEVRSMIDDLSIQLEAFMGW